ncbi:hypothetical protein AHF37_10836 [Paragonimus kellicotti]|nr:hypothetical protein AHF37_10836 [Paragonimus kellicotti]
MTNPVRMSTSSQTFDDLWTAENSDMNLPAGFPVKYLKEPRDSIHLTSKSEEELLHYHLGPGESSAKVGMESDRTEHKSSWREGGSKWREREHPRKLFPRMKSNSPSHDRHTKLRHQNSSPLTMRGRASSSHPLHATETSFLSNLTASRPSAARGLLGVASAALAASRAGTFASMLDDHKPSWTKSRSFDKRSVDCGRLSHDPHCYCCPQHTCYQPPPPKVYFWQGKDIKNQRAFMEERRRNSDSVLEAPTGSENPCAIQIVMCTNCKQHEVYPMLELGTGNFVHDQATWRSHPHSPEGKMPTMDANRSPLAWDPSRPMLHSSWVALSDSKVDEAEFTANDPIKSTSAAFLNESPERNFETVDYQDSSYVFRDSTRQIPFQSRSFVNKSVDEQQRRHLKETRSSKMRTPVGYNRIKKGGLDAIGLDLMRINGARPESLHLKEAAAPSDSSPSPFLISTPYSFATMKGLRCYISKT